MQIYDDITSFYEVFLSLFRGEEAAGSHDKGCREESAVVLQAPAERGSQRVAM